MRTFIAIELPIEIKEGLAGIQRQLKECGAGVKWVEPKNIHLTLKFLGELNDKKIDKITQILQDCAKNKKEFSIRLSSIGAFPQIDAARVIWVGIDKGDNETKELALDLEERIAKIGIPKEKRAFSSHITIGRTKRSGLNQDKLVQALKEISQGGLEGENLEFPVKKITFFKSILKPQGPIYEALKEAVLEG